MRGVIVSRDRLEGFLDRHWVRLVLLAWAGVAVWLVWSRWNAITWLALGDTDDNMRMMQVRGLLGGQDWYDLRQYRLAPPQGLDIHWTRLVDLPIAGLYLLFQPLAGHYWAERLAAGFAPLLPLAVTFGALGLVARRLIAPSAWPVAIIVLLGCAATMLMYMPLRIDHHGWQLAMLSLTLVGLSDAARARGGAIVGVSSALSLTIGLEMLPYCAMAGGIVALRWVWDRGEAARIEAYALTLAGGSALGFALFASTANQAMRCDALTPVWLSVMVTAGLLLFALARLPLETRVLRLVAGGIAGAAIVAGFATLYPQCINRPEGISDELARMWFRNVREAKPIYEHPLRIALPMAVLPAIGVIGGLAATWQARARAEFVPWLAVTLFCLFAGAALFWQMRTGPAAQLLSVPGSAWLIWTIVPWTLGHRWMGVRVLGSVGAFLVLSGLFAGLAIRYFPIEEPSPRVRTVNRASALCNFQPNMAMLNRLPPTTLFTHVDLGPRLITMTHHKGITGPYHRNGEAILSVHKAFSGPASGFRAYARRYGATHVLTCPNLAESTVYRARSPNGFYAQLAANQVPGWLEPVPLPPKAPYRLWRIRYDAP